MREREVSDLDFADFTLSKNLTDAEKRSNEWIYRKIEHETDSKLSPLWATFFQVVAITGCRVSDVLNIKKTDLLSNPSGVVIRLSKESLSSSSSRRRFAVDRVREKKKREFYFTGAYQPYAEVDRMSIDDVYDYSTPSEKSYIDSIALGSIGKDCFRSLPPCLMVKMCSLCTDSSEFIFNRSMASSNRCRPIQNGRVTRQAAWKQLKNLNVFKEHYTGREFINSPPLTF